MIEIAILLFAYAGFTAICVSMSKHQPETLGRRLTASAQLRVRVGGWAALVMAYICAVIGRGVKFGSVEWVWALILSAFVLVVVLLPHRPRLAPRAGVGAAATGALLAVASTLTAVL